MKLLIATIPPTIPGPYVGVVEITSDARGRFAVSELPEGKLIVRIQATTLPAEDIAVLREDWRIEEGKETKVEIHWDRGRAGEKH